MKLVGEERPEKVDIEGSEMDFFEAESAFLRRVQTILLEWHKWRVELPEIKQYLARYGFLMKTVLHDGPDLGTAVFEQASLSPKDS